MILELLSTLYIQFLKVKKILLVDDFPKHVITKRYFVEKIITLMKYFKSFLLVLIAQCVHAQPLPLYSDQHQKDLQSLAKSVESVQKLNLDKAFELAQKFNWPLKKSFSDGSVMQLAGVSETGEPLYEITYLSNLSAVTIRTNYLYEGGGLGLNLTGGGVQMRDRMALWDGGAVLKTHKEFGDRIKQIDAAGTTDSHATHVSGTMIASGINPSARGMANAANLMAYDFGSDNTEMATASSNLLISNHSYGTVSGWRYNADRAGSDANLKWEWYGDTTINAQQDYKFGFYDSKTREWDRMAYNAPYYLIVKSAGNDHGSNGPPAGTAYFFGSSSRTSKTSRANQNGYDQISLYGGAKNILTVGAISALSNGYNLITDPKISGFSSWGPTDDGRVKPDVVANGVSVLSTTSTSNNAYTILSGTSMASPNASGSVFLLQELNYNTNGVFLKAASLKGLVIHTADDAGNVGPDYQYGWGVLNMKRAAEVILNKNSSNFLVERTLNPNEVYTTQIIASGKGLLVATISWSDPEATATTANATNFNSRIPKLINDLDLRISDGTTETLPFILNPDQPAALAARGDNIRDNVEQIIIPNAVPGKTYTITIKHKGTLTNEKQDYALIVSGVGGKAYCELKASSNADGKILKVVLGNVSQNGVEGCQTYNDFTSQVAEVSSGQAIPLEVTVGSCGQNTGKIVKVFVDWNNNASFEDTGELMATSAVLNNNDLLKTSLLAPSGLVPSNYTRVRIVCVETSDAANVSSCGSYAKGETQEYLIRFTRPTKDLAITALVSPSNGTCANQVSSVTLNVANKGTATQANIAVSIDVQDSTGTALGTISGTLSQSLAAFTESKITLTAPFLSQLEAGKTYTFVARLSQQDQDASNNQLTEKRTIALPTPSPIATATFCGIDPVALINRGSGLAFWYDSPTAGALLASGNLTTTNIKPANNTYYVAQNQFSQTIGPSTKTAFGGGTYGGNFGPAPYFRTEVPLMLESARLYIANAGKITFTVSGLDDTYISSTTIDVSPTRNASAPNVGAPSGQIADDPNDQGAVYQLNLSLPTAGDYKVDISYANGASIYRSNVGVTGFPFKIPNIITYRGAIFDTGTKIDTLTAAYYYFYDLKISSLGCASNRIAVVAQTANKVSPTITYTGQPSFCEGSTLQLNTQSNTSPYQWYFNNQPIKDATNSSYSATVAGNYSVSSSVANCLPTQSEPLVLTTKKPEKPVITVNNEIELSSNVVQGNQWYLNNNLIQNAINQKYTALQSGGYSVKANVNGCGSVQSDEKFITITSVEELAPTADFSAFAYPNPTQDKLVCEVLNVASKIKTIDVSLFDINGQLIARQTAERNQTAFKTEFNLDSTKNGTIFAVFRSEDASIFIVKKILKQ